ncbi:hypothetical protein UFOVP1655_46 [uncultured Caudovirales phage]|uniref:Uncharacterized protein n=1 Tax=uncultured Caudovirales phage TaxID=2100421 RepID=A0A6J5T2X9_9CAUD|nr:hypothetical protein UFOVP1655_46 [uncultured Caudovirales phage]
MSKINSFIQKVQELNSEQISKEDISALLNCDIDLVKNIIDETKINDDEIKD